MLVTIILGDCPGCGEKNCFGNVSVRGSYVLRGCKRCKYSTNIRLPKVRKKILYLDQFFFSSAFREGDSRFIEAAQRIRHLCARQLLAIPFSSIHADETHQWGGFNGKNKKDLMEFTKATSRGHEFVPAYDVELTQIIRAFQAFLAGHSPKFAIEERDVIESDVHKWEDYFRIDVGRYMGDAELIRDLKQQSITELLNAFDGWRKSTNTFAQDVAFEMRTSGEIYQNSFFNYATRIANGDYSGFLDRPIISTIVEKMLFYFSDETQPEERLKKVDSFFSSEHFAEVPYLTSVRHKKAAFYKN